MERGGGGERGGSIPEVEDKCCSGQDEILPIFRGISLLHQERGEVTPVPAALAYQKSFRAKQKSF